ncbi:unnamed protein product, partial [Urochloa humidicola]
CEGGETTRSSAAADEDATWTKDPRGIAAAVR